jgi:F-box/WD-40 domain protein MET30
MLQGILTQCCFPQLSYLSANVRELIRIDFLSALPAELSYKVLCFLDTTSLCKAAQVSRKWRSLADDDVIWHRMCEQHIDRKCTKCGWGLPLLERKRLRASKRQIQLRATGRGLNEWSPNITPYPESTTESLAQNLQGEQNISASTLTMRDGTCPTKSDTASALDIQPDTSQPLLSVVKLDKDESYFKPRYRPWKDVYKDRFKVCTNWKYGRCSVKIFKGHTNGIICLQFDDNVLITGSYDATIKVWDLETCKVIRTLRGHDRGIRCLQFDDTKLISGSMDTTIKVWNWHTGECVSTYNGHNGGVIGLHFDSALLASGSVDSTIKIWNFEDKSTFVLRGHTDWVNAVKIDSESRTVFSASDDCTVRLWDLDTGACIKTFEGHVGQVQQVITLPPEFELEDPERGDKSSSDGPSSPSTSHLSLPTASQPPASESFGPGFADPSRRLPPRYILTGALDSTIRLWDTATHKCLRTYFGHVEGVWALAADTLRVVSGAEDCMAKVWDARTGKCDRTFTGHAGPVTCLGLSDSRLCTGGEDGEVRMYCF